MHIINNHSFIIMVKIYQPKALAEIISRPYRLWLWNINAENQKI